MRVVFWARLPLAKQQVFDALKAVPETDLIVVETLPDLLAALKGAEALILYDAPPDQAQQVGAALSAPDNSVRWMHFLTAGREGFDAVGLPKGVAVSYPAGCVAPTVAEHAMALLLALVRCAPAMLKEQAKQNWSRSDVAAKATSLEGKIIAIVGYGRIGREVAKRARGFGVRILAVSRTRKSDEWVDEGFVLSELDEVLARADIVMLTVALTPETRHLFDRRRLEACKPGVVLINVARGGLVDQVALGAALSSGQVGAAGLNSVVPEPLPAGDPLWSAPNLLLSPHFAGGGSAVSMMRLAESAAGNLRRLIKKQPLKDLVS